MTGKPLYAYKLNIKTAIFNLKCEAILTQETQCDEIGSHKWMKLLIPAGRRRPCTGGRRTWRGLGARSLAVHAHIGSTPHGGTLCNLAPNPLQACKHGRQAYTHRRQAYTHRRQANLAEIKCYCWIVIYLQIINLSCNGHANFLKIR